MDNYEKEHRLEYGHWYPCPELGLGLKTGNHPINFAHLVGRMFYAFSIMADIPDKKRNNYLDFGSGSGTITDFLAPGFKKAIGVERRPEARAYATMINSRSRVVTYVQSLDDAKPHAPFDFVTMTEVIEHMSVAQAEDILTQIVSMMNADASFFLTTPIASRPDGLNPNNQFHIHEFNPMELKDLLDKYFGVVKLSRQGIHTLNALCLEPKK